MDLRADCARCDGLCCVALAFDRSALFGYDKPAGEPCRHLTLDSRCGIHARRAAQGFAGCAAYDCKGAGQAATALFVGLSWRDSPSMFRQVLRAFQLLRRIHEAVEVLHLAGRLDLRAAQAETRDLLLAALDPPSGWTYPALLISGEAACDAADAFLGTLKSVTSPPLATRDREPSL